MLSLSSNCCSICWHLRLSGCHAPEPGPATEPEAEAEPDESEPEAESVPEAEFEPLIVVELQVSVELTVLLVNVPSLSLPCTTEGFIMHMHMEGRVCMAVHRHAIDHAVDRLAARPGKCSS